MKDVDEADVVSNLGLKFAENVKVKGRSGVKHIFKLAVKDKEDIIAIVHGLKHLTIKDIFRLQVYKKDTGIPQIALYSKIDREALKTASQLNIDVADINDMEKLKLCLEAYKS